jgi:hypothetical protein
MNQSTTQDTFRILRSIDAAPLESHEVKVCFQRAAELESCLNQQLGIKESSKIKVSVYFHASVNYHEDYIFNVPEEEQDCDLLYSFGYCFFADVKSSDKKISAFYARDIYIPLDSTNDEAMTCLSKGLIGKVVPPDSEWIW